MVANWKMNLGREEEAKKVSSQIKKSLKKFTHVTVVVCPSFVHLSTVSKQLTKTRGFLGAQDCFFDDSHNPTGETSVVQLQDLNVSYCIVGHSEQRDLGETNKQISQKIVLLLKRGITPILCIGEHKRDRQGMYIKELEQQLKDSLALVPKSVISKIVIAYEPLWAIGKNAVRTAKPEEIEEVCIVIKRTLSDLYHLKTIPTNTLLYGGSVSRPQDALDAIVIGCVDGCLVGRASLSAKTFIPLLQAVNNLGKNQ